MLLKVLKRDSRAPEVAATTLQVMITIVEWPNENQVPTVTGWDV